MSSKNAEKGPFQPLRSLLSPFLNSIATRLVILFFLSSAGMLLVTAGILYWTFAAGLEGESTQFLADNVHVLQSILREHPEDRELLIKEVQEEGPAHQFFRFYARVQDGSGALITQTPGISWFEKVPFPAPSTEAVESHEVAVEWVSPEGKPLLLMSAWAPLGTAGQERFLLQFVLDVSRTHNLISQYRRRLITVLVLGLAVTAAAGYWIARKGLAPLATVTSQARQITSAQLHERIGSMHWPIELQSLAVAFDGMLDRLEESFLRLSRFSGDLAHEIRTPINNLMGETEVALSRARTPDEYRDVLGSNLEEYRKLSRFIDKMLFLARADDSRITLVRNRFNAGQEMESVRQYYQALAEEQGIEVICEGDVQLCADRSLFHRALSNLLSNSLTSTPAGGKIVIQAKESSDSLFMEISVSDNGGGISSQDLPHVFERFYRGAGVRTFDPGGTGLGLAIVKSIMDLHGGSVSVESTPGSKTVVLLRFPQLQHSST